VIQVNSSQTNYFEIVKAPPQLLIEDLGRPGFSWMGVGPSGACDLASFRLANRLVGNQPHFAGLEILYGPCEIQFQSSAIIAITGATHELTISDRPCSSNCPNLVGPGEKVSIAVPEFGLRSYLAVKGGIYGDAYLGSSSSDTLSGIGPAPLVEGDRVAIQTTDLGAELSFELATTDRLSDHFELSGWLGPRCRNFTQRSISSLAHKTLTATKDASRIGVRFMGAELIANPQCHVEPEGILRGFLQAPPSGEIVVFLADHPTTGGYPIIGALDERSIDLASQIRPGDSVTLRLREN
jgi:biotin-dependent carboxylase-like uncharacterized protein